MQRGSTAILVKLAMLVIFAWMSQNASAQVNAGSLSGTVQDSSGAVLPGASLTLQESTTGSELKTVASDAGVYNFVGLLPGTYTITVERQGFKRLIRSGIVLTTGQTYRIDLALELGAVAESVDVTATAPLLEERTNVYGTTEETQTLAKLPLQLAGGKRDPASYIDTIPGSQGGPWGGGGGSGFTNNINGSVGTYSELMIDGVPGDTNPAVHGSFRGGFPADTLSEFRVVSSASAEFGLTGGNTISFVTKSGTNAWHGSLSEYVRNEAFDARNFFAANVSLQKQHEFGGTFGGPVIIPKLYNGRNKTFFFTNIGRFIFHSSGTGTVVTYPTDGFKNGDFSQLLGDQVGVDALGRPVRAGQIYDPATTRSDGSGGLIRDPFPGNIIPSDRFSPVSAKFQAHFPALTSPGQLANNFIGAGSPGVTTENYYVFKVDQVTAKNRIAVLYWRPNNDSSASYPTPKFFGPIGNQPGGNGDISGNKSHKGRINFTRIVSPNIVVQSIAGIDHDLTGFRPNDELGQGGTEIGLNGVLYPCTPQVNIAGGFPALGPQTCYQVESDTNWRWFTNVSVQHGSHSLKFGSSYNRWTANFPTTVLSTGRFNFLPAETGLPNFAQTGAGYASFLLGAVDSSGVNAPHTDAPRLFAWGFYAQDEWRVSQKLTVNLGLRWDIQFPFRDAHDLYSFFDASTPNPAAGGLPGALVFAGEGAGRNGKSRLYGPQLNNFGPRIGVAYKLLPKTVVRGSYGLYYGPVGQNLAGWSQLNRQGLLPSFSKQTLDGGITPAFNWTNGFPLGSLDPTIDPSVANGNATAALGRGAAQAPTVSQLNFNIQHELPGSVLVSAAYIGSWSHHVGGVHTTPLNQLDYSRYGKLGNLLNADIHSPEAQAAGIAVPFAGFQGTVAQALRPYPQFLDIQDLAASVNNVVYNSAQFIVQKRYSSGLSFLLGYTIAKGLGDTDNTPGFFASGPQDAYNRRAEKAPTDVDVPQQLMFSYAYELPFGTGKKFSTSSSFANKYILGGWTISGFHVYQKGNALAIVTSQTLPTVSPTGSLVYGTSGLRPDRIAGVNPYTGVSCGNYDPQRDTYLNRQAFADPQPFSFGNAARRLSDVRGCPQFNENVSLAKYVPIRENRVTLKLGIDAFNVFNRHNWAQPSTNIDDPNFGKISGTSPGRTVQLFGRIDF